jgi:cytochrome c biogenesis protein CcmG, thiol:disulfide interchange protein DsbE
VATRTKNATRGSTARKPAPNSSRLPLLLGGVAILVVAVLIAVFSTSGREAAVGVDELAGAPVIDGEPLPTFGGDTANDPALGARPPVITGADFDGITTTIGETGTPQMVMFLASWCPACQAELPEVVAWLEAGNLPEGVELTAVATGLDASRPNWPPDDWFEREGYEGPLLVDDAEGAVAEAYGLSGTPYWVALDADGQVVARIAGMIDTQQLSSLADALAAG